MGQRGTATDKYLTSERTGRGKVRFLAIISGGNCEFGKIHDIRAEIARSTGCELLEKSD